MKNVKKNKWLTRLTGITLLMLIVCTANAQHAAMAKSTYVATKHSVIFKQVIVDTGFTNKSVEVMIVNFPPRSRSAAHRHPCPTIGYVISGDIVSVFEGKTYHYKAGDSFYETPNGLHNDARNDSYTKPAKLLVTFLKNNSLPTIVPPGDSK